MSNEDIRDILLSIGAISSISVLLFSVINETAMLVCAAITLLCVFLFPFFDK